MWRTETFKINLNKYLSSKSVKCISLLCDGRLFPQSLNNKSYETQHNASPAWNIDGNKRLLITGGIWPLVIVSRLLNFKLKTSALDAVSMKCLCYHFCVGSCYLNMYFSLNYFKIISKVTKKYLLDNFFFPNSWRRFSYKRNLLSGLLFILLYNLFYLFKIFHTFGHINIHCRILIKLV